MSAVIDDHSEQIGRKEANSRKSLTSLLGSLSLKNAHSYSRIPHKLVILLIVVLILLLLVHRTGFQGGRSIKEFEDAVAKAVEVAEAKLQANNRKEFQEEVAKTVEAKMEANSISMASSSPDTPLNQCPTSLADSNGLFCTPEKQWARIKRIARRQRLINTFVSTVRRNDFNYANAFDFYQTAWEPEFSCPEEMRVGKEGDGGKWLCDPERLLEDSQKKCIIYSFGSENEYSFESSIHHLYPHCIIHTFDHTVLNPTPPNYITFHKWGVSDKDQEASSNDGQLKDGKLYRIPTILKALSHVDETINVLKIDVEWSEYSAFTDFFAGVSADGSPSPKMPFQQILIELHTGKASGAAVHSDYLKTHKLLMDFARYGNYVVTHKEPNIANPACCTEFVLFKMSPSFIGDEYLTAKPESINQYLPAK
eukprot:Nk52_evm14s418 gene=Nk52_evmTU14s418